MLQVILCTEWRKRQSRTSILLPLSDVIVYEKYNNIIFPGRITLNESHTRDSVRCVIIARGFDVPNCVFCSSSRRVAAAQITATDGSINNNRDDLVGIRSDTRQLFYINYLIYANNNNHNITALVILRA